MPTQPPASPSRGRCRGLLWIGLAMCLAVSASAQTNSPGGLVLRGIPAADAFLQLAERSGISVVFNPLLPGLDQPVWCGAPDEAAETTLACIADAAGLDYIRRSTGTYVVTERVVATPQRGDIVGGVLDVETREPLAAAHVRLLGANLGTTTDGVGSFAVRGLLPGRYELAVSYVGYETQRVAMTVQPDEAAQLRVRLKPVAIEAGTVVVDGVQAPLPSEQLGANVLQDSLGPVTRVRPLRPDAIVSSSPSLTVQDPRTTTDATAPTVGVLGVTSRTLLDGLSIQGGDDGESPVRLDGATIYEPVALGTLVGALSPLAIGRVTIHKAGYGVEHGSTLAGLVEAEHTTAGPNADAPLDATLEADALAVGLRVRSRLNLGGSPSAPREAVAVVSARASSWPYWRPSALSSSLNAWNRVDPVLSSELLDTSTLRFDPTAQSESVSFVDLHAASRITFGALKTLRASMYHGQSRVRTDLLAVEDTIDVVAINVLSRDRYAWTNSALSLRYDELVSPRWSLQTSLTASRHTLTQRYDVVLGIDDAPVNGLALDLDSQLAAALGEPPSVGSENRIVDLNAGVQAEVRHTPRHRSRIGAELAGVVHQLDLSALDTSVLRSVRSRDVQPRLSVYASDHRGIGARWTVEPGLRLTVLPRSGQVATEPRASLRYDALPEDRLAGLPLRGLAARLAVGVYRQFVSRYELATFGPSALAPSVALWLPAPADTQFSPPVALHAAAELLWQRPGWVVRTEAYAKSSPRIYSLNYGALLNGSATALTSATQLLRAGEGRALGLGVHVERYADRWAVSGEISLARSRQRADGRFCGTWVPTPWEEPLHASLAVDVALLGDRSTSGLLARSRGVLIAGRSWAFRRAYYDVLPVRGQPTIGTFDASTPGDDILPAFTRVDVGLAWRGRVRSTRIEAAFEVTNATNRKNVLDLGLERKENGPLETVTRRMPGVQPSVRLRILR